MRLVIPTEALDKLPFLREQYQKARSVDIEETPSMIGMPTMFGGTDVKSRKKQIVFLEKLLIILRPNLKKLEEITSPEELQANITAWRVYLTACWYVQSQNNKNSKLSRIINEDLGITAENYPDDEDKENCYATAKRFVNTKNALEDANVALIKAKKRPFSEKDWSEFTQYLSAFQVKKVSTNSYTNYPITSITQPLFSATFAYTGATVGLLSGDVLSKSTKGMAVKYQLTALIGSSLLLFGPTGPTGVALFAPVIASKLITSFCSITLAHVLGATMGILGYGVGTMVGLPLDLAYHLLWKICAEVGGYYYPDSEKPTISGIRISDGVALVGGIAINITPVDQLAEIAHKKQIIELKEDGSLHVDGKPVFTEKNGVQLPPMVIEELKEKLKTYSTGMVEEPKIVQEEEVSAVEDTGRDDRPEPLSQVCTM
ncbi:type IV secretion protein Dot [Legionella maioricensis]|uniref:Type IV secretion protein Dot n=1 Tax=Legionella maioricensis TaxID=2896528 RepID=A0A9X2CX81_9GAMM|nr:type IV secretion protein Dot [Legionella maioricensis]MCL9682483.1 type IV secretion protein Dot [Legionella maioricensis]MCL9686270.1 type IV secretion protein Dot [Legionella maioricensis]